MKSHRISVLVALAFLFVGCAGSIEGTPVGPDGGAGVDAPSNGGQDIDAGDGAPDAGDLGGDATREPDVGEPDPQPAETCDTLGLQGRCDGDTLVYCIGPSLNHYDCRDDGLVCGFRDAETGFDCLPTGEQPEPTADTCPELGYRGRCDGDVVVWCQGDVRRTWDCASDGKTCAWTGDAEGYDCTSLDEPVPDPDPVDPDPVDVPGPDEGCGGAEELAVIELLNAERASSGLGALRCDPLMAYSARLHSQDMCDEGDLAHTDSEGRSGADRASEVGVEWSQFGENIARGQTTPEAVHRSWMNSWRHRQNRMSSKWGRVGVGYVRCGDSWGHYWTEVFAD